MALFEYFPNYIWNLSLAIAIESGAPIGEVLDIAGPVKDAANAGADAGTQEFLRQWMAKADTLIELAAEDEARGRGYSAGTKLQRAALYLFNGERMQGHGAPGRMATFAKAQQTFRRALALGGEPDERDCEGEKLVDRQPRVARTPWRLAAGASHLDIGGTQPAQSDALRQDFGDLLRVQARV